MRVLDRNDIFRIAWDVFMESHDEVNGDFDKYFDVAGDRLNALFESIRAGHDGQIDDQVITIIREHMISVGHSVMHDEVREAIRRPGTGVTPQQQEANRAALHKYFGID